VTFGLLRTFWYTSKGSTSVLGAACTAATTASRAASMSSTGSTVSWSQRLPETLICVPGTFVWSRRIPARAISWLRRIFSVRNSVRSISGCKGASAFSRSSSGMALSRAWSSQWYESLERSKSTSPASAPGARRSLVERSASRAAS